MGGRVSRVAIDALKGKIRERIKVVEMGMPQVTEKVKGELIRELGLTGVQKEWEKVRAEVKKLEERKKELARKVNEVLGGGNEVSSYSNTLMEALTGNSYNKTRFDRMVEEQVAKVQAGTVQGREVLKLKKLLGDVDLTLELAGSTAETKAALKGILEQIGEVE